ncbi:MAG: hypothetical protein JXR48_16755 [Candidatus Delongbacteria bacterium]|nr:hypothetical protein [Candidatus Delongbacteria bacterium]MBN2836608.1 hypothetical protein [Candidatus Delongbacteria bacterium]
MEKRIEELINSVSIIDFKIVLDSIPKNTIFEVQKGYWVYAVNELKSKYNYDGDKYLRQHVTHTENYMFDHGCTYDSAFCKAKLCVFTNPDCAVNKIKQIILDIRLILDNLKYTKENK